MTPSSSSTPSTASTSRTHIVATYYLSDRLPGVDFIDHFALIESIALEGSTGTWEKVEEDTEEVREKLSGKLVGYFEIPSDDEFRKSAVVQLAFPINAWDDNVPMMLLSIAGNCFAYSQDMRLLDVFIPEDLLKNFKGPKFGVPGIRKLLGVKDRPLSLHIIKPKMGMTPEQTGRPGLPDRHRRGGHVQGRRDDLRRLQQQLPGPPQVRDGGHRQGGPEDRQAHDLPVLDHRRAVAHARQGAARRWSWAPTAC